MAKKLPEELEALIQEYLTDGVITDKERQVILKEAEKMKLDRDMVDLIIDARQQKIDQESDATVRRKKGKSCPHCGAYVSQLTDKCPECGQYITPEATKELEEILENLEDALVNMKSRKDVKRNKAIVERYARKARMYYSNHPKIKVLLAEVETEVVETESKIKSEERNEAIMSVVKNKWLLGSMPLIIAIAMMIIGFSIKGDVGEILALLGFMGLGFGILVLIYIGMRS